MTEKEYLYHKLYFTMALNASEMSYCKRRKVGALILTPGDIITLGWNGAPSGFDNKCEGSNGKTLPIVKHAERNAIRKFLNSNVSLEDSVLYVTTEPCLSCAQLIEDAKIKTVFYLEQYTSHEGVEYLKKYGINIQQFNMEKEI